MKHDEDERISVGMVVYSVCPADPRVRREAEALAESGMAVHVVCLQDDEQPRYEVVNGVHLHRVPLRRRRGGKLRYLIDYGAFIVLAGLWMSMLHLRHRFDVVHVHNMPDILVVSALLPRLTGARMILDLHDPMPEVYMTKYGIDATHPIIRLLIVLERFSIGISNRVLTPNIAFRDIFVQRGCPPDKVEIIMNSPDLSVFGSPILVEESSNGHEVHAPERFVLMYHGTVVERHGLDTALHAVALLREEIPGLQFHVFGGGDYVDAFLALRDKLNLEDVVTYHGWVSLETVAEFGPKIDLGLVPNKKSVFTEINLPTRLFEYLCMGKPVVAPETKGIRDYFPADALYYFEQEAPAKLAAVIRRAWSEPRERQSILKRGQEVYLRHQWSGQRARLIALVRQVARRTPLALPARVKGD